ncbi:GvpL/GvpF family gas vesicle protein [Actinopolymorpha pittospori]
MRQDPRQVRYLYAIVRAESVGVASLHGVGESGQVRLVSHADLAIAVSDVARDALEIPEEEVSENGRVAELAMAHDAVVRAIFDQAPALPLRLATVVVDDQSAVRVLEQYHDEAVLRLDRLDGHREWGVRLCREQATQTPSPTLDDGGGARPTGTAYLQRRRQALRAGEEARQQERGLTEDVFTTLGAFASEMGRRPGASADVILNAAYLVDAAAETAFLAAAQSQVGALAPHGIRVDVTGPWPPYSFAQLRGRAVADA